MPAIDWNAVITFAAGAMFALLLGVITNLITPDRRWLLSRLRSIRARSSAWDAKLEIDELRADFEGIEYLAKTSSGMLSFVARHLLVIGIVLCANGALEAFDLGSQPLTILRLIRGTFYAVAAIGGIAGAITVYKVDTLETQRQHVNERIGKLEALIKRSEAAPQSPVVQSESRQDDTIKNSKV